VPRSLRIEGLVVQCLDLTTADLETMPQHELRDDFRCREGWVVPDLRWGGVLLETVLALAKPIAFLVAYGELAIGLGLALGILVRAASICGLVYMLALLFSSNYPGPQAVFWQYFGASLDHLVLAFCFATFVVGNPTDLSLRSYWWPQAQGVRGTDERSGKQL